ncbi:MAG: M1 family aminopeptidase [Thermoanaerobaculia bacterium]
MRNLRLLVTTLVLCLPVSLFAAAPLTDFVAGVNNLKLAPEVATVSNTTWTVGHMKVRLTFGSIARVMAGNEPIGVFFKGNGSFDYETVEAAELPVVAHNVKVLAHVKMTADANHATLSDDFTEVLLVGGGVAMPEVSGSGGASLDAALKDHVALYGRLRTTPTSHVLTVQKFSFPASKVVVAEFRGGKDNIFYALDNTDEALYTAYEPTTYGVDRRIAEWLVPGLLSAQPVGHDHWTTPRPSFVLTAVDYALTADGDNAHLEVTETIARSNPTQNVLQFNMNKEDFVKPGAPFRKYNIRSVTDEQGRSLPFDHDLPGDLVVAVDGIPGPSLKLKFSIDGDFLVRQGGDNAWQLYVADPWLPLPPEYNGCAFTIHSVLKVKKPFIGIAPGNTISRRDEGDYNIVENVVDKPVQFATAEGGRYTIYEEKHGTRTIRVATYGLKNERASKQLANLASNLIDNYEFFLGPFPFAEFNIIQVNTYGYGQAPPGTMYITNEAFNPTLTEVDQVFSEGINERFAHEIAHQYWAHVVRMPSSEEQWLTESFAEYSAALALKQLMPQGDAVYNRLVASWRTRAKQAAAIAPIPYANRIAKDETGARTALLYDKGPLLLYTIHKEIGDTPFLTFLKSYTKSFNFKFGTTKDVAGLLGVITKKDWKPFFDQYFWGTAMPQ